MMKSSLSASVLSVGLVMLTPVYAAPTHAKQVKQAKPGVARVAPPPPVWHSDLALANVLGPEIVMENYAMRLPNGYRRIPMPNADAALANGYDVYVFSRDRLPDGSAPTLAVAVVTPPPSVTQSFPLSEVLENIIEQKRHKMGGFTESRVERGKIGTLTFARVRYKGTLTGPIGTRTVPGIAYAAVDGRKIMQIQAEDVAEHARVSLPLMEASILTFHRQ